MPRLLQFELLVHGTVNSSLNLAVNSAHKAIYLLRHPLVNSPTQEFQNFLNKNASVGFSFSLIDPASVLFSFPIAEFSETTAAETCQ